MEEKAIRKRPMFMIACVFTAGTVLAEQITAGESLAEDSFPLWIFPAALLLIALAVSIDWLRQHRYLRIVLWNLIIAAVFVTAFLHCRGEIRFRQAYLSQLTEGETVTVCGRVERKEYKNDRFRYYLTKASARIGQESYDCNSIILYYDTDENKIGDTLLVTGEVYLYAEATNEGMFDLRAYYESQKIDFALFPSETKRIRQADIPWKEELWKLRNRLELALQSASDRILFSSSDSGLMAAMLLGDKGNMDDEVKNLYQDAGISHILAISGLHISILGMALYRFLRKKGAGFAASGMLAGIFLLFYAQMTGCAVSTERAVGMVLLTMAGAVIGRQTDMLNSLGVLVLFLLWNNPFLIGNSGFVFTVAAILGITVTGAVMTEGMEEKRYNLGEEVREEDEKIRKHLKEWKKERKERSKYRKDCKEIPEVRIKEPRVRIKEPEVRRQPDCGNRDITFFSRNVPMDSKDYGLNREAGKLPFGKEELPLLFRMIHVRKQKLLKCTLPESLLSGLAITLTTLPIVARYYFQIPVYSFLLNLLVLPLTGILMISGVCGMLAAVISPGTGALLLTPAAVILRIYTAACQIVMQIPGSQVITGKPALERILIYYGVLGAGLAGIHEMNRRKELEEMKMPGIRKESYGGEKNLPGRFVQTGELHRVKKVRIGKIKTIGKTKHFKKMRDLSKIICIGITVLMLLMVVFLPSHSEFELDILDVGQGDGIFLQTEDGITCFWDGGSTSVDQVGEYRILPFLKSKGIRQVDYWFVTHSDTDHVSGLKEILEEGYQIRNLVISAYMPEDSTREELEALALANHTKILCLTPGDCIKTKTAVLTCLYPDERAAEEFEDVNNLSLTMLYEEDGFSGIFAGDIPEEAEELLVEEMKKAQKKEQKEEATIESAKAEVSSDSFDDIYNRLCNITFYKVNHHGSKYSSSTDFMEVLSPDIAIISCGINNRYGHPAAEAIERIEDTGCRIFYTMNSGEIKLIRKGKARRIMVRTFLSN